MITPVRREMSETIGTALTPAFSRITATSCQRSIRGRRSAAANA
jgi:hypothetical protein